MIKTLRISFSLKNTYRVNTILYSMRQIPFVKKLLPEKLFQVRGLKIFANVLAALWEVITIFAGKWIYFFTMVCGIGMLYQRFDAGAVFAHILFFLTIIGAYMNTSMLDPTRDKYYAMILMRMNARKYTLVNFGYVLLKTIIGFLPMCIFFGLQRGVPLWFCLVLPLCVAGAKIAASAGPLREYEKNGCRYQENKIRKRIWLYAALLLIPAYALPAAGIVMPLPVSMVLMLLMLAAGAVSARKILSFRYYREINQELLAKMLAQVDSLSETAKKNVEKNISTDTSITSSRTGFEYLNELFIRRHRKILWKSSLRITAISCAVMCVGLLALIFLPELKTNFNSTLLHQMPSLAFIMYAINRGTGFTQALFMNCDHSLLTYSFYKKPEFVLRLFRIRLREIIKINALPAAVIGAGLCAILYVSGGAENPVHYAVLFSSVVSMSVFFSIHYLTLYYLLQPYNAGTEIKSGTYQVCMGATYFVCWMMTRASLSTLTFGILCVVFCILYSAAACLLVYKLAPKTFRIRP